MRASEIISLLKEAKTREQKLEVIKKDFQEIPELASLPTEKQEFYAGMIIDHIGEELTKEVVLQAYFSAGQLFSLIEEGRQRRR